MVEKVEYELNGKRVTFTIKKVTYGQWQKVMSASGSGNVELLGNVTKGRIDTTKMTDELMKIAVSSDSGADFHDLSMADGMDLQDRVMVVNGLSQNEPFRAQ